MTVDRRTGKRTTPETGCLETTEDLFPSDAPEPPACSSRDHIRADLPYPLQRFPIERDGSLRIPPEQVVQYVSRGAERFRVIGQGQSIQFNFGGRAGVVRLAWNATDWQRYLQTLTPSSTETDERHGTDGSVAQEVEVNTSGSPIPIQLPVDP